ncbi:peptidoglycan DD-metalloendopeptidase family protein [Streptomyces niveus]|uniref:Peptidoglycan DD-metalloendopeptidase family protein n=1 Tax=Streptomyces niveus TaxID=193462 RepID=A0ABZ2A7I5_STRNV|nr:peptidoglycan DD-metalloendopeptidase family protein [Streptomyces niveus]
MTTPAIVGTAAVDVVPIIPNFHNRLKALVLPIADRVGADAGRRMGEAISNNIVVAIPNAVIQGGNAARNAARRQGDDVGGAFAGSIRRKLTVAFKAMPKLDIRLGDTGVDAELARLRARMETLSNKRIGIDVDAGAAKAEIKDIEAQLKRLGAEHPNVAVRADTAAARAALASIRADIRAVDAYDPRIVVDVDTSGARSALMGLGVQMVALTAIPLGPVLAAGLGAVVSMAATAGAGVAAVGLAAIPAIKGVADAVRLKNEAEKEAANASRDSADAGSKAAQSALQQAGAQASLSAAHRQAASSIAAAERAVADATERAADQREQAADAVRRAEQSLTDAKRTARQAEQSLTEARAEAADQLRELSDRLVDGHLDQREATLRVTEAERELQAVLADTRSTDPQKEAAQLAFERAVQNAKKQKDDFAELQKSAAEQRKAGVDGSEAVRAATERVGDAQRGVADQTRALQDAQEAATDAQRDGQRAVADAVRKSAEAQQSAAESIASAQRGVASAQLSAAKATGDNVTKQAELREALAKLTPEGRALYTAFAGPGGLSEAFTKWSRNVQPDVLPLFTRGVDGAKASLPGLTPLVEGAARGIDTLMDKASAQLKTPFWKSFTEDLAENVEPAVVGFGVAFGNVIAGVVGVIDAFLPHMDGIADKSDSITERFAKWGTSLKGSPDFEKFLAYVKETSPGLASFLGSILTTVADVGMALAPLSEGMYAVVQPIFEAISWVATESPGIVQTLWTLYAVHKAIALGMVAFAAAMGVYNAVMIVAAVTTGGFGAVLSATGILPIIRAFVIVVGLVAAGLVLAYTKVDWFRAAVDGAWAGIKASTSFLWEGVLKPAFSGIWTAIKAVGDVAVWLWGTILKPTFSFIGEAAQFLVTAVVTWALLPIYLAFQVLGGIASWLWAKAIKPAFDGIAFGAKWLWEKAVAPLFGMIGEKSLWLYNKAIKPAMSGGRTALSALGDGVSWLWRKVVSPVFNQIGDKAGWLYRKAIKPPFDKIREMVRAVSDSFQSGQKAVKAAWDKIEDHAKEPVKFILDFVYNRGIVPLWNKVAGITGAKELKPLDLEGWHTGGIMSGYSPGRDDRIVAVGGGEAIMRPEWTRAVGADRINEWNAAARQGGISGVQRAISSGMPAFKDGGVVGWLKDRKGDVGDFLSGVGDFMDPTKLFSSAASVIKDQLKPYLTNPWAKEVGKIPGKVLSSLKDKAMEWFSFGGGGGQWMKPVNAPYGTPFGKKGSMWSSGRHTGLDFPAATGALIKAVAGGKVSQVTSGGPYGKHALISHGGGLQSLYAHMSSISAKLGQTVNAGSRVGAVGATGNVTGPHLHLEARRNGKAIDPMPFLTGGGGGSGGKGVERWRGVVQQALKMTGNPAGYANLTLRRMNQESGGDPNVVNKWDSNWKAGHPSVGLMQVIRGTFKAYAGQMKNIGPFSYGVSTNPLANVFASMRYAKSRYGSLPTAYNRPGGYAEGGFPQLGELAWVGENGPELVRFLAPAQVHSNPDSMALARQATSLSAGRSEPATVNVEARVFVGDREITDIVRVEVEARESETAAAIDTGRWV